MRPISFLNVSGAMAAYRADDFDKYRSRMHDVTHAIDAGAGEVFVTEDKRFRARLSPA